MPKKPERLSQIYKDNSQLHWLATRTQQLDKLNTILQKSLPIKFSQHCYLANIHDDRVIVHTDNANYASLLRYQSKSICSVLSAHLPHPVSQLEIKVRPRVQVYENLPTQKHELTNKTAVLINNTADSFEDGALKQALKKLAKHQTD